MGKVHTTRTTKTITTGKSPNAYIQRTKVNEVEQTPEEIKFKFQNHYQKKGCRSHKIKNGH